jgi:DNA-binding winged helix-turn-helix (wHTH) protein
MVDPPPVARFGPYEADLATGELRRDGARVPLQDKPFQILARLLRRPGELVTREDLRAELWPADTFVDFEHGLNTAVKKLRQALDDSADTPRFVETLPRRGYRFVAPVSPGTPSDVAGEPASAPAAAPSSKERAPNPWHPHAAGALVVLTAVALVLHRGDGTVSGPPANARPVIVLMDSPLRGRVYDPRTAAAGGTNADDITDSLHDLPVVIEKENTSAMWHREEQVVRQNPDLIISHLSCLLDERFAEPEGEGPLFDHLFTLAQIRLAGVFGYVGSANPRTRFLVYSRGSLAPPGRGATFVSDTEARFPVLRGRIRTWNIPGDPDQVTFRDPDTARLIREQVRQMLELP